jgi:hypothetical protein
MKALSLRVLRLFGEIGKDRLDLHVLFEAAGNEPTERRRVIDAIGELTRAGMLDACGGDFYALTERGKEAIARSSVADNATLADGSKPVKRDSDGGGGQK